MATSVDKLMQLKEEIVQAKIDSAKVSGAIQQNLERLKTEFQCRSLPMAQAKLTSLKQQKETLQVQIEQSVAQLESSYSW